MSSLPMNRFRTGKSAAMFLSVAAALLMGNAQVRSDLIATANGSAVSSGTPQTTTGSTPININAGAVSANGLYDVNSVLYLTNNNAAAQTVTAQYTVGGVATGSAFTVVLPGSGTLSALQTVALPQQMNLSAGSNQVGLRVINTTGGAGGVTITGSSLAVTGYTTNGISSANGPGSANLATNTSAGGTGPVANLLVSIPGNASAQGLYSLNTSLTINNSLGAPQLVTARYTVDGTATGTSFALNIPGTSTGVLTLPTQISGLGAGAHQIGIELKGNGAGSITVASGSSIYATSYNSTGGSPSVVGATVANQNTTGDHSLLFGGTLTAISATVPVGATSPTFWDVNGSIMFHDVSGSASPMSLIAQYLVNGIAQGPSYTVNFGANGLGAFSMPTQFASLIAGQSVAIQLTAGGSVDFAIDSDSLSLVAHNQNPSVATPEPASLSLAAMAMMAFGAAGYRRRKNNKTVA